MEQENASRVQLEALDAAAKIPQAQKDYYAFLIHWNVGKLASGLMEWIVANRAWTFVDGYYSHFPDHDPKFQGEAKAFLARAAYECGNLEVARTQVRLALKR